MLDAVRGKVLAAVAEEEVQTVKYEVDNWMVVSEITAAISSGGARVRTARFPSRLHAAPHCSYDWPSFV